MAGSTGFRHQNRGRIAMRQKRQKGRPGNTSPATSRLIYPKPQLGNFTKADGLKDQNLQNGQHRARFDWGSGAVCFGVSPVASALDLLQERDSPKNRFQTNTTFPEPTSKPDISTLLGLGHFYFALTIAAFRAEIATAPLPCRAPSNKHFLGFRQGTRRPHEALSAAKTNPSSQAV